MRRQDHTETFYGTEKARAYQTPEKLLTLRERLHLSRSVFARVLSINERTLENREQGRAGPNAQAVVLIRLVEYYPDTVERLSAI